MARCAASYTSRQGKPCRCLRTEGHADSHVCKHEVDWYSDAAHRFRNTEPAFVALQARIQELEAERVTLLSEGATNGWAWVDRVLYEAVLSERDTQDEWRRGITAGAGEGMIYHVAGFVSRGDLVGWHMPTPGKCAECDWLAAHPAKEG